MAELAKTHPAIANRAAWTVYYEVQTPDGTEVRTLDDHTVDSNDPLDFIAAARKTLAPGTNIRAVKQISTGSYYSFYEGKVITPGKSA